MVSLKIVKPTTDSEKVTRTVVDTIEITPAVVNAWIVPPFQRHLKVNDKVRALAEAIKGDGGVIPGVITLGVFERKQYLLDGQHRREAFLMSECQEGYVDIRQHHFDSMAEMGEEFVALNSQLVVMKPDDILRGLEGSCEALQIVRNACPWVGYDQVRRGARAPLLGMAMVMRCWAMSGPEVPTGSGMAAVKVSKAMTPDDAALLVTFLLLAHKAWGAEADYVRLWGAANLTICMWLYRRTVVTPYSAKTPKLTKDMFTKCLMSLSADAHYVDWLVGRLMSDKDRSPTYSRIKAIFAKRIEIETGKKPLMPSPAWSSHSGRK